MSPILQTLANSSSYGYRAFAAAGGDYESIATVSVGSTPQSSISFSSIPSTYQHLQIRAMVRQTASANYVATFNSDGGGNYSTHRLMGDGSNASAAAFAPVGAMYVGFIPNASFPGSIVMDIFNYSDTNTYKTIRALEGSDVNGATGYVTFWSGNWRNTNAVNTITLTPLGTTFAQYSSFALYGIKG